MKIRVLLLCASIVTTSLCAQDVNSYRDQVLNQLIHTLEYTQKSAAKAQAAQQNLVATYRTSHAAILGGLAGFSWGLSSKFLVKIASNMPLIKRNLDALARTRSGNRLLLAVGASTAAALAQGLDEYLVKRVNEPKARQASLKAQLTVLDRALTTAQCTPTSELAQCLDEMRQIATTDLPTPHIAKTLPRKTVALSGATLGYLVTR